MMIDTEGLRDAIGNLEDTIGEAEEAVEEIIQTSEEPEEIVATIEVSEAKLNMRFYPLVYELTRLKNQAIRGI